MPNPQQDTPTSLLPDLSIPAPVAPPPRDRRPRPPGRRDPHLLATALFAAYAALSLIRYEHLATRSWDLGIFEQAVRAYARLQAPVVDLKGPGFNILGDHFSPVLALLAPVYRLFPSPVTLLVAQAALFAVSAVPVTRAAAGLLGRARGLVLGTAYGLSWGLQRAVDFDFHEICFAVPLIAFSLEALLARRWRPALWWALPLVLVKEDLGLTVAAIALVVALRCRRSPRPLVYALAVAVLAIAATLVTLTVVIPSFNTTGGYGYWTKVDSGFTLFDGTGTKLRTLAWLLIPTSGLLALRSPLFAVALPTLGWRFYSADDHYWGTDWHYSAVLMPVVALALVDALARARMSSRPWLRAYAQHAPAAVAGAALALTTTLPLSTLTDSATYDTPEGVPRIERALARIPNGATVEADIGPSSRLTSRCRVFWIGDTRGIAPDYIAFNNTSKWVGDVRAYAHQLHPRARYVIDDAAYGYVVLRRSS